MYRVDGPLGPVETGGVEQRALTKPGMPGDPFWCPNKGPVAVPVSVSVDDPAAPEGNRPRPQIHASARLFVAKALRTPPARKLVALFDFLSSNSRLTHSSSLKLSSADRCETHETETVATDKHTKYLRGHLAVVAPSKTIASRHPIPDWFIIQRQRRQQN